MEYLQLEFCEIAMGFTGFYRVLPSFFNHRTVFQLLGLRFLYLKSLEFGDARLPGFTEFSRGSSSENQHFFS